MKIHEITNVVVMLKEAKAENFSLSYCRKTTPIEALFSLDLAKLDNGDEIAIIYGNADLAKLDNGDEIAIIYGNAGEFPQTIRVKSTVEGLDTAFLGQTLDYSAMPCAITGLAEELLTKKGRRNK